MTSISENKYLKKFKNLGFVNYLQYAAHQKTKLTRVGSLLDQSGFERIPILKEILKARRVFYFQKIMPHGLTESINWLLNCTAFRSPALTSRR
jgi:hypothetical protein